MTVCFRLHAVHLRELILSARRRNTEMSPLSSGACHTEAPITVCCAGTDRVMAVWRWAWELIMGRSEGGPVLL